ncbi:hypothetical protein YB2330_005074 [Saitoella coloradoensis]
MDDYDAYEDEIYKDDPEDQSPSEDEIDSEVEEDILAHVYYTTDTKGEEEKNEEDQPARKRRKTDDDLPPPLSPSSGSGSTNKETNIESTNGTNEETTDVVRPVDTDLESDTDIIRPSSPASPTRALSPVLTRRINLDSETSPPPSLLKVAVGDEEDADAMTDLIRSQAHGRYFADPAYLPEKAKGPKCHNCGEHGHMAKSCSIIRCMTCGVVGEHETWHCPSTRMCNNCGGPGHLARHCPQPRKSHVGCSYCGSRRHMDVACPQIWRCYVSAKNPPQDFEPNVWCYNCAAPDHYGDDCTFARRGPQQQLEPSAFCIGNVPQSEGMRRKMQQREQARERDRREREEEEREDWFARQNANRNRDQRQPPRGPRGNGGDSYRPRDRSPPRRRRSRSPPHYNDRREEARYGRGTAASRYGRNGGGGGGGGGGAYERGDFPRGGGRDRRGGGGGGGMSFADRISR